MPRSDRLIKAAALAAVLLVVSVPFAFRRPASTISSLGDLAPLVGTFARNGTGGPPAGYSSSSMYGALWGEWSLFPYSLTTALFSDSSYLVIVESPVGLETGMMPDSIIPRDLGGSRYALVSPGPGADPLALSALERIGPQERRP